MSYSTLADFFPCTFQDLVSLFLQWQTISPRQTLRQMFFRWRFPLWSVVSAEVFSERKSSTIAITSCQYYNIWSTWQLGLPEHSMIFLRWRISLCVIEVAEGKLSAVDWQLPRRDLTRREHCLTSCNWRLSFGLVRQKFGFALVTVQFSEWMLFSFRSYLNAHSYLCSNF